LPPTLAALADVYVNDAFGAAQPGPMPPPPAVTEYLKASVARLLMEKELQYLSWKAAIR